MKLLALHLTNVRKFTGKRASITGIGNGITVISEANEFGKSTFFDALHALFFEKYSSTAKPVKSLQPYAGGAVEVAADVQTDQGKFRVEKRFLSRKSAKITRLPDGGTIAQDDEAERWISTLLGTASDGPAGLLWVRQGQLGLQADSAKEKSQLMETRRDLLSSVAGEIDTMTGGRRMDRVMRRVAESLAEITTKTGRKSGPWKSVSEEAEALETELEMVTAQVQTLEKALSDRKQDEAALKRLDNAEAKTRRNDALAAAKAAMEDARAHIGAVKAAERDRDLARLKSKNAQDQLDVFLKAIDRLQTAQKQAANNAAQLGAAKAEALRSNDILGAAEARQRSANEAAVVARKQLDIARRQLASRKAKAEAAELADQIAKAGSARAERDAARAETKASFATADWLRRAEEAHAEVSKLAAAAQAQATTFSVAYDGELRITRQGADIPDNQAISIEAETPLDLPGIGTLTIHAKAVGEDGKLRLDLAQNRLKDLLAQTGALTIQQARTLVATRLKADAKAGLAQAILDTLAPNGLEALRIAKADADLAANGASEDTFPAISALEALVIKTDDIANEALRELSTAEAEHANAREISAKLLATAEASKQAVERAGSDAGPLDTQGSRRADHLRQQAQEQEALTRAEADLAAVVAAAPDVVTAAAELKRSEDAVTAARQQRAEVGEHLAALSSKIQTLAGNGIEERRDELAGELETARATETRFAHQAAALSRLKAALEAERKAARDTYFGPVQEELKPLLSILHRDAALSFDSESLLPTGLTRDQAEETLEDLSAGTKEQIAILTRLAFARLFSRQGRHMPIILDDALVYSDDDRIIKMFTALTRVAQDQQIIVFSCRQLAFQDLGGVRPNVEITQA